MKTRFISLATIALICALASPTLAGGVIRGGDSGYDAIDAGAWDLTFVDATFLSRYSIVDEASAHSLSFFGGPALRYFVMRNFSIHLTAGINYDLDSTETPAGETKKTSTWSLLPFAGVDYYIRLPGNFFLKPGLSGGYYYGKKSEPISGTTTVLQSDISGFAGRLQLALVYYAGPHMNIRGGLDLIMRFGSDDPETGDSVSATQINTGFTIGIGYTF